MSSRSPTDAFSNWMKLSAPSAGQAVDIRESKRTGEIGSWFNTVAELDKLDKEKSSSARS